MDQQAWRDFFITLFFLGIAFIIAILSSVAAEQNDGWLSSIFAAVSLLMAIGGAVYIVPKLARKVQLEFLRFSIKTAITVEGLIFSAILLVIAFAAWNTGNNLLYLVLSAMMAFLFAANLIARSTLADISVQLRFPDHIFAAEPTSLFITVTNHKRLLPSFSLTVEALPELDASEQKGPARSRGRSVTLNRLAHFIQVPARASVRQRINYTFKQRGRYPITAFRISTRFPTGLFRKWRKIEARGEILVYPKPLPLDDFYHALPMLAGQVSSHARGRTGDLYAIRRYHPSDHMRHIDWKATAKAMALMVREYTREDERRLTIVLDTSRAEMNGEFEERFERAIVMAASLANHFILEHADVELVTPIKEHNVASGTGFEHLYKILRSLATLQPCPKADGQAAEQNQGKQTRSGQGISSDEEIWPLLEQVPILSNERQFKVLITSATKGTIPASVWRSAHIVFMEDL
jgi:uncharacterized protein (DUF58 family)